jgi:hypothetical protein
LFVDGKETTLSKLLSDIDDLKRNGYFVSMGVHKLTGSVLISASKNKPINRFTMLVTGMTVSGRTELLNKTHAWDYIGLKS